MAEKTYTEREALMHRMENQYQRYKYRGLECDWYEQCVKEAPAPTAERRMIMADCRQACPYNTLDGCKVKEYNAICPLTNMATPITEYITEYKMTNADQIRAMSRDPGTVPLWRVGQNQPAGRNGKTVLCPTARSGGVCRRTGWEPLRLDRKRPAKIRSAQETGGVRPDTPANVLAVYRNRERRKRPWTRTSALMLRNCGKAWGPPQKWP